MKVWIVQKDAMGSAPHNMPYIAGIFASEDLAVAFRKSRKTPHKFIIFSHEVYGDLLGCQDFSLLDTLEGKIKDILAELKNQEYLSRDGWSNTDHLRAELEWFGRDIHDFSD